MTGTVDQGNVIGDLGAEVFSLTCSIDARGVVIAVLLLFVVRVAVVTFQRLTTDCQSRSNQQRPRQRPHRQLHSTKPINALLVYWPKTHMSSTTSLLLPV